VVNPKSLKNLKQFKDGDAPTHVKLDGEVSLTAALKRYYRAHPTEIDALAASVAKNAHESSAYAREVWDRLDGKLSQPVSGSLELHHDVRFVVGKGYQNANTAQGKSCDSTQGKQGES